MTTSGKNIHLLVRPVDQTGDPLIIKHETEDTHSMENELMDEVTKLGRILEYGITNESFEVTAYGEKGDAGQMAIINAIRNKKKLDVWRVDASGDSGPYPAIYGVVLIESVEKSSSSDSFEEVSATMQVENETVEGELTALPASLTTGAGITFKDPNAVA